MFNMFLKKALQQHLGMASHAAGDLGSKELPGQGDQCDHKSRADETYLWMVNYGDIHCFMAINRRTQKHDPNINSREVNKWLSSGVFSVLICESDRCVIDGFALLMTAETVNTLPAGLAQCVTVLACCEWCNVCIRIVLGVGTVRCAKSACSLSRSEHAEWVCRASPWSPFFSIAAIFGSKNHHGFRTQGHERSPRSLKVATPCVVVSYSRFW